jgi:hypothetical protein
MKFIGEERTEKRYRGRAERTYLIKRICPGMEREQ